MTKYKIGDKIKVKEWETLVEEYGFWEDGKSIDVPYLIFSEGMKESCGKTKIIEYIDYDGHYFLENTFGAFNNYMFEEGSMVVTVVLEDGSILNEVYLFVEDKAVARTHEEIEKLMRRDCIRGIRFSGRHIQGKFINKNVRTWCFMKGGGILEDFIRKNQDIYDINVPDVTSLIKDNKEELLDLLKRLI